MDRPTILLTGASGGLGGATARLFAGRGWTVFAADLAPVPPGDNIVPLCVDVTSQESVDALLASVADRTDSLDAVVPFAGVLGIGPLVDGDTASAPSVLAEAVWRATTGRPRHRVPVRWDATRRVLDKLPVPWVDALLKARFAKSLSSDAVR